MLDAGCDARHRSNGWARVRAGALVIVCVVALAALAACSSDGSDGRQAASTPTTKVCDRPPVQEPPPSSGTAMLLAARHAQESASPRPQLRVLFTAEDLDPLYQNNQSVGIIRDVSSSPAAPVAVVWVMVHPLFDNRISWDPDAFWVYGTTSDIRTPGTEVTMLTAAPVVPGAAVRYNASNASFQAAGSAPGRAVDIAVDGSSQGFSLAGFGFAERATVNGSPTHETPFALAPIAGGTTGRLTETGKVTLFVGPSRPNGVVLGTVPAAATTVDLSKGADVTLQWCSQQQRLLVTDQH